MNNSERTAVHCTGIKMTARLYCEFGEKVFFNNVGNVIELK